MECPHFITKVDLVMFECDDRLLSAFSNCSSQIRFNRPSHGRTVYDADMTTVQLSENGNGEYLAVKKSQSAAVLQ